MSFIAKQQKFTDTFGAIDPKSRLRLILRKETTFRAHDEIPLVRRKENRFWVPGIRIPEVRKSNLILRGERPFRRFATLACKPCSRQQDCKDEWPLDVPDVH
jgi:hypothetical protein